MTDGEKLEAIRKVLADHDQGEELLNHDSLAEAVQCLCEEIVALRRILGSLRRAIVCKNIHEDRSNAQKG